MILHGPNEIGLTGHHYHHPYTYTYTRIIVKVIHRKNISSSLATLGYCTLYIYAQKIETILCNWSVIELVNSAQESTVYCCAIAMRS